jgi:Ser/Thr protein kinase RdoA (MazF antagonist)
VPDAQTAPLDTVARGWGRDWLPDAGQLPVQVIHGDLASGNTLVDPEKRCGHRPARLPAVRDRLRGYASVRPLSRAEAGALPALLLARSFGSALWQASHVELGEVTGRITRLGKVAGRVAAHGPHLESLAVAASGH